MYLKRSQTTNKAIKIDDTRLIESQSEERKSHHNPLGHSGPPIIVGHLVMLKDKLRKNQARQVYVVVDLTNRQDIPYATIQKFDDKFMSVEKLLVLPNQEDVSETKCDQIKIKPCQNNLNDAPPAHSWNHQ